MDVGQDIPVIEVIKPENLGRAWRNQRMLTPHDTPNGNRALAVFAAEGEAIFDCRAQLSLTAVLKALTVRRLSVPRPFLYRNHRDPDCVGQ